MEARGYQGGEGRTKYRQLNWGDCRQFVDGVTGDFDWFISFITFIRGKKNA